MIYALLKILSRLTIWGYFRKVKIVGKENVPAEGPYIFVANHPSAFMDPIVVATSIKPSVYFIAAGEYVGKGVKGWFFQKALHMIPVFRPSTRPEEAHKNKDMFLKCHEHLTKRGALLIFPEGVSLTDKKLKPLKTGTVRIALGAEQANDFELNIPIIPIGLNYSDPHQFRSDLFVKIGAPIYIKSYINAVADFNALTEEGEIEFTKKITEDIEIQMRRTIVHVETNDDEILLEKLNAVFSTEVKRQFDIKYNDQEGEFEMQKDFLKAIHYYKKKDVESFNATLEKVDNYLQTLEKYGLSDKDIGQFRSRYTYRRVTTYFLGFPFFLVGLITNYLPYRIVGMIVDRIRMNVNFQGSMALALGLFLFLFWYLGLSILAASAGLGLMSILVAIPCYIFGLYALVYQTAFRHSTARKRLRKVVKQNQVLVNTLLNQRAEIVSQIASVQAAYLLQKN